MFYTFFLSSARSFFSGLFFVYVNVCMYNCLVVVSWLSRGLVVSTSIVYCASNGLSISFIS